MRSRYTNALNSDTNESGGCITARRRRPIGWKEFGHVPPAVQASSGLTADSATINSNPALFYLAQANGLDTDYSKRQDIFIKETASNNAKNPAWLPINKGEQLCNLVGRWRILQRVGSHRWTTDDIVTAYIAATSLIDEKEVSDTEEIKYLDLGTGNGSVLQMVSWYLLSKMKGVKAYGVEARSEAVGLARRSLAFNLGSVEDDGKIYSGAVINSNGVESVPGRHNVQVVNGDFRDLVSLSRSESDQSEPSFTDNRELKEVASNRYDLITGTPPYFRVDFSTEGDKATDSKVTAAVINQGGMPTSMQSAPARCEVSLVEVSIRLA